MQQINSSLPVLASAHDIDLLSYMGSAWVDGETVGRKLGYEYPAKAINNLYQRHKNEFKDDETSTLKLRVEVGGSNRSKKGHFQERDFRLFSAHRGALRLCMLSNAPNRAAVHDEILDLFDTYRYGFMLKSLPANTPVAVTESWIKEIKRRMGANRGNRIVKALFEGSFDYGNYVMPMEEIARMPEGTCTAAAVDKEAERRGCHKNTVYREAATLRDALGIQKIPTKATKEPRKSRADKGKHKMPEEIQKIKDAFYTNPHLTNKEIWEQSGTAYSYDKARRILREIRGSNALTSKGRPKKTRCTAGAYTKTPEYKLVVDARNQNPKLQKKDIARMTGVSYSKVCRWLRAANNC